MRFIYETATSELGWIHCSRIQYGCIYHISEYKNWDNKIVPSTGECFIREPDNHYRVGRMKKGVFNLSACGRYNMLGVNCYNHLNVSKIERYSCQNKTPE